MAQTPDPAIQAPPAQSAATAARPTLRGQIADNPLLTFLGGLVVVLLAAATASPHMRIGDTNDRLDRLEDAIGRLDNKIETRFDRLDNKIDSEIGRLDNKINTEVRRLDNKIDTKFEELNNKIDTKFEELDTKFDELDDRIDRIELKLAELITALQTSGVIASAGPG